MPTGTPKHWTFEMRMDRVLKSTTNVKGGRYRKTKWHYGWAQMKENAYKKTVEQLNKEEPLNLWPEIYVDPWCAYVGFDKYEPPKPKN